MTKCCKIGNLEVELRGAKNEDIGFVYELMHSSLGQYFEKFTPERWSREKFKQGYIPSRITIIEHEGMPIGFFDVEINGQEAYIHNLEVSDDYRNGFGIQLMKYLDSDLRKKSLSSLKAKIFQTSRMNLILKKLFGFYDAQEIPEESSTVVRKTWK